MTETLKLRVRNFLGLESADLTLNAITLVAGINGAGKSSLCEAAACVLTSHPLTRGQTAKKNGVNLVRNGADRGIVSLDCDDSSVSIAYPECSIAQNGPAVFLGSVLGTGATKFMALTPADRTREIHERFDAKPTLDDLRAWIKDHPDAKIDDQDTIDRLWNSLDVHGWDATYRGAREHGTKLKAKWEAITNKAWGTNVAASWCPSPLLPGERYNLDKARDAQELAQERLEELLGFFAVSNADLHRLQKEAKEGDKLRVHLEVARQEGRTLARKVDELVASRNRDGAPVDTRNLQGCPHCGGKLHVTYDREERYVFIKPAPPPLSPKDEEAAKRWIEAVETEVAGIRRSIAENGTLTAELAALLKAADQAAKQVEEAKTRRITPEKLAAAREEVAQRKTQADAIKAMQDATAIYEDWKSQAELIDALAPDGIRLTVMRRALAEINTTLAGFSAAARFGPIALTDDAGCTYDGRPYELLSESERWRVDLVLCCLLAKQEQARLILADRLDVLHPQARSGALVLLRSVGIPSLVCMTARDQQAVPDLTAAGYGQVRWLEKGMLQ